MTALRIAALTILAFAASAATHIQDTLLLNDGVTPMHGAILVTGPNGGSVPPSTQTITIGTGGAVDFSLVGCPGCKYTAQYNLTNPAGVRTQQFQETWIVPDTSSAMTVKALWGGTTAPYYLISREQINPAGLLPGQMWLWDGRSFKGMYPAEAANATIISGTVVDPSDAADQVMRTSAPNIANWISIADCTAAGGALRYSTAAHQFSCHLLTAGDIPALTAYEPVNANIQAHISRTDNPHSVTKAQVGLGNADNTSDANKPVSTAQASALANKADTTTTQTALDLKAPLSRTVNGHALTSNVVVTTGDLGIGNVDNTRDLDKPVSTPQQTAIDGRAPLVHDHNTIYATAAGKGDGYYCERILAGTPTLVPVSSGLCGTGGGGGGGGGVAFDSATGLFDAASGLFDAH